MAHVTAPASPACKSLGLVATDCPACHAIMVLYFRFVIVEIRIHVSEIAFSRFKITSQSNRLGGRMVLSRVDRSQGMVGVQVVIRVAVLVFH